MSELADREPLTESTAGETEVMRFSVSGELYGIDVAQVKEIIMAGRVKPVPHSHPAVEGVFKPRESLINVIDLAYCLFGEKSGKGEKDLFIITGIGELTAALRVNSIAGISRISNSDIHKPDSSVVSEAENVASGIVQCEGELVTILDLGKILKSLKDDTGLSFSEEKEAAEL